jgi:cytochrome c-type biogenesis protein CcmH/NrfF
MWLVWVLLLVIGVSVWLRGRSRRRAGRTTRDTLDQQELEAAEEEVRRLGLDQKPDQGWQGDDWGPGIPR